MLFLKRLFNKRKIKGRVVCDLNAREIGEVSNIRLDKGKEAFEILTRDTGLKLSFPADQFFVDESGRFYLLPKWSYRVRVSCSELLGSKKRYDELNLFAAAIEPETFRIHLADMTMSSISCGEEIIQHLPKFEEYLLQLKREKTEVMDETSRLMTLRLLGFGGKPSKSVSTTLTKKEYSLKIIELRRRYGNISRLAQFISELYEDTKTGLSFLSELLDRADAQREASPSLSLETQEFMKRANNVCVKGKEITKILDGLVEAVITV